ncbi:MAG TPA: STAS domain-containing protein [Candidatus Kapabacteria bacterium]|nr:STAS domain-containing protein [Candidatus Kapabacteria bacterium]
MTNNNKLEICFRSNEDITIIELIGFLDAHTAPEFENSLKNAIDDGIYKIIVNFKKLDYISSAGLGVLMAFIEDIRLKDGDIKLAELSDKVYAIFDLLGFPMLFDIDIDENISLNKFKQQLG